MATTTICRLRRFGTTELPSKMAQSDVMGGTARMVFTKVVGGYFDEYGTDSAIEDQRDLIHVAIESSTNQSTMETNLKAYEALRGVQAKLYREWGSGSIESLTARCKSVTMTTQQDNLNHVEVRFAFVTDDEWTTDTIP